jgi:AcrR family transcriptional regulator
MRQDERSSQLRLLEAARTLFAERGYEATTIADITRAAKTSHSHFLKYYSGKEELRREIIERQWSELTRAVILAIPSVPSATEKLKLALNMFISFLENDSHFRAILLLEYAGGRDHGTQVNRELREFVLVLDEIVNAMKSEGELRANVHAQALRSALVGSIEGMMRDQLLASAGFPAQFSMDQVRATVATFVAAASDLQRPTVAPQAMASPAEATLGLSPEDEWIRYYLRLGDAAMNPSELS